MYHKYNRLRRLTGKIHLWLGMATGMIVLVVGLTGCLYTFMDEIRPLVYHDRMYSPAPAGRPLLALPKLQRIAEQALGRKESMLDIQVFTDPQRTIVFRYRDRNNRSNWYPSYFIHYDRMYLNPRTGKVICLENSKWEFFNVVVMLHCSLLLGNLGKQIITWSTVVFVVMLLSGLYLWWPKNRAAAGKRFRFKWKAGTNRKRKNYDLHQIPGFYSAVFTLCIAVSGLVMVWYPSSSHQMTMGRQKVSSTAMDKAFAQVLQESPDAEEFRIYPAKQSAEPLVIRSFSKKSTHYADHEYCFDGTTGLQLMHSSFSGLTNGGKLHELSYDIHVGAIGGLPGKMLAFLASLTAAALPVTGFLIWKARKNKS